ncbi:hypothetical protein [Rathayibacter iranicus]|nr:hypothetical protein [Rathayibacter iranicus]MWV29613.1 hypothetical protein [Rathayibacter iranicus NCPPB 2253 = VKM Ac-1602]
MILLRTHANRWIARAHRSRAVLGSITLVEGMHRLTYRTVRLDPAGGECVLLRDTTALEEAFAVLLAGLERSGLLGAARSTEPANGEGVDDESMAADIEPPLTVNAKLEAAV